MCLRCERDEEDCTGITKERVQTVLNTLVDEGDIYANSDSTYYTIIRFEGASEHQESSSISSTSQNRGDNFYGVDKNFGNPYSDLMMACMQRRINMPMPETRGETPPNSAESRRFVELSFRYRSMLPQDPKIDDHVAEALENEYGRMPPSPLSRDLPSRKETSDMEGADATVDPVGADDGEASAAGRDSDVEQLVAITCKSHEICSRVLDDCNGVVHFG